MTPQDKTLVSKYTLVAKKIIYDAGRMKVFLRMLGTKPGAIHAVHTVLSIIEKHKHIPPQIVAQLGVNAYMIMVDMAQEITKHKADPHIVHDVVAQIMASTDLSHPMQQAPATQAAPAGIIGGQLGAAS